MLGRILLRSFTNDIRWANTSSWVLPSGALRVGEKFFLTERYGKYFIVPNARSVKTKIIATIGPKNCSRESLTKMMESGMICARINCSHGEHSWFEQVIKDVREIASSLNLNIPIMLDTKGPEIRTGKVKDDIPIKLEVGQRFDLIPDEKELIVGDQNHVGISYKSIKTCLKLHDVVLVDDGLIGLSVQQVENDRVICSVINSGLLGSKKGVNLPGIAVDLPNVTEKDKEDIMFGVKHEVEFIAHSFTRNANAITTVKEIPGVIESGMQIIAKIENQQGINEFEQILNVSDGIMVARGDLGVEIPLERVCTIQKKLIRSANISGKFVITATQMLDSMIKNPRPTRAEAADVSNACFDGTDCVMLSGETAKGDYPVEAIQVMSRICKEAESDFDYARMYMTIRSMGNEKNASLSEVFAASAVQTSMDISAKLLVVLTKSGKTARTISKYFPHIPVLAVTTDKKVAAQLMLHRAINTYVVQSLKREGSVPRALAKAKELGMVNEGDRIILVTGENDQSANRIECFTIGNEIMPVRKIPSMQYGSLSEPQLKPRTSFF